MDMTTSAMTVIANAGEARSSSYLALTEAKKGNFQKAERLMEQARKSFELADKAQKELLGSRPNQSIDMLVVHSQDHLMTGKLAQELIQEIIIMYKSSAVRSTE